MGGVYWSVLGSGGAVCFELSVTEAERFGLI
jgi:hypothetical protein